MKYENEITVMVGTSLKDLEKILEDNGLVVKERYQVIDDYMIKSDYMINDDYLEALRNCVLVRNIIDEDKDIKEIVYKYKEYNEQGDIIKQGKIECEVKSLEEAKELLKVLGYKELFRIYDQSIVYANDETELCVQLVNNKYIYIEMEQECHHINKKYRSIEEIKKDFRRYNIPIKGNSYFMKKAEIELRDMLENKEVER